MADQHAEAEALVGGSDAVERTRDFAARHYSDDARLNARIALHKRFGEGSANWYDWVFERMHLPKAARILEIGAGTGELWAAHKTALGPQMRLVLSDLSDGMLASARQRLQAAGIDAEYVQADACELPFERDSFDVVIANHMLYHVGNRRTALEEIDRVLKTGGTVYAATNGRRHMAELIELQRRYELPYNLGFALAKALFSLENGGGQLAALFPHVEMHRYPARLRVTEVEPLIDYLTSLDDQPENRTSSYAALRQAVQAQIEREGAVEIQKDTGLFIARKHG
ncbi:MAG: class I SAM-dependent methyltransferase [Verrucomicrobiota bacterium]